MKSTRFSFFSVMGPVLILWAQLPSVPAPCEFGYYLEG